MHPFTKDPHLSISSLGERALLENIRGWLGSTMPEAPFGMGDDCAILPDGEPSSNLLTVDALLYGRHFTDTVAPESAGAYLLKRNLSDIAAMGGTPQSAVLGLFLPKNLKLDWLKRFFSGLRLAGERWGVSIVGGDLCESEGTLGGHLTLLGHAVRPLTRRGAAEGDHILVSGSLGGSLESGKHHSFEPRLAEGRWLAEQAEVHAATDITDGLVTDLQAITPDNCLAAVNRPHIPLSRSVEEEVSSRSAAENRALYDGEDYELLFAIDGATDPTQFILRWKECFSIELTHLGEFLACPEGDARSPGRVIDLGSGQAIASTGGYEHFGEA